MAEKKYVEVEALVDTMQAALDALPKGVFNPNKIGFAAAIEGVKNFPAADVRPVVLCRDCMLRQYCKVAQYLGEDGFCSNAVRRNEGL